jgi:triacylglycerol lipase
MGDHDAWGTIESNAAQIAETLRRIIDSTGSEKVNLIAHSKGGVDCRCLIGLPGCSEQVASLTTIASPHHGSGTLGWLFRWLRPVMWLVSWPVNLWYRLRGDKRPDFYRACLSLTPTNMTRFNEEHPPSSDILYRHYATAMRSARSDVLNMFTYRVVKLIEGENDGIVATAASRYDGQRFRGVLRGASKRGVSHIDAIDFRRRPLTRRAVAGNGGAGDGGADGGIIGGGGEGDSILVADIVDYYIAIVRELRDAGL